MTTKMTTNSQISTTEPKNKNKLNKHLEQEQNPRNGDHMEGHQWGRGGGEWEQKVQGIRGINGRHKINREKLRLV